MDILNPVLDVTLGTVKDVLPIAAIIFGFQFLVLRQKPANLGEILAGFAWVLVGLSLFLLGLEWCLFPLGRLMAEQLTDPAFVQAAGFLQGPVRLKSATNTYGYADLGNRPDGTPWPDSIPYTGYIGLAIDPATGRAIGDDGFPINTLEDPGSVADSRVEYTIGNTAGGPDNIIQKYKSLSDDIPLLNWREMRLIQAEAAGPGAAATALVNSIRTADGLPVIAGAYLTLVESDADRFLDMIIEERRRSLWLEARYWATKLQHTDMLWFPRAAGDLINSAAAYSIGGGVRLLLGSDEYQINPNLRDNGGLALRATGCDPDQAPVGF